MLITEGKSYIVALISGETSRKACVYDPDAPPMSSKFFAAPGLIAATIPGAILDAIACIPPMNASCSISLLSGPEGFVFCIPCRTISVRSDHLFHSPTACMTIGTIEVGESFDNNEDTSCEQQYFVCFFSSKPIDTSASSNIVT